MARPTRTIVLELPREPVAATIARRRVRHDLDGLLGPQELCDLAIVVSELVANAVVHGQGAIRLRIEFGDGELKGEVCDEGHGFERPAHCVGGDQLQVRGLLFVDRLASRWGVQEATGRVWFEMPVDARAQRSPLEP